jgi:hypothetical protein
MVTGRTIAKKCGAFLDAVGYSSVLLARKMVQKVIFQIPSFPRVPESRVVGKRAAKTEQTTVRRFFSEVALRWLAHYGGGGGVVSESLPKAPPWHPKVMLV